MTSWIVILACISGLFFWKTNLTKFSRSYLSEKGQKAVTTAPEKHTCLTKGKERRARRKKGGEEKKAMATLLVFIMAIL